MNVVLCVLSLGAALVVIGALRDAQAQAPPPPIEGQIYAVTYVEVMPTARVEAIAVASRYREATRREEGNLRCEVLSRVGLAHQLVILEVWKDQRAFEAHRGSVTTTQTRERLQAIRNAPLDQRVHVGVSVGPLQPGPAGDAVYVVTHVDVIPPRKDDGLAALETLAGAARGSPGNLRFEVVQQTNRPNHFTIVEIWKDAMAVQTHSMAEPTRLFRDRLGPISGALYDERQYRALE